MSAAVLVAAVVLGLLALLILLPKAWRTRWVLQPALDNLLQQPELERLLLSELRVLRLKPLIGEGGLRLAARTAAPLLLASLPFARPRPR